MASAKGIKAGRAFVEIGAVDKTAAVMRQISARLKGFGNEIANIGKGLITKGLAALGPGIIGTKIFAGFDDEMRKVKARSGATAGEFKRLTDQAKLLGRTTSFTAAQVAGLQATLAQMGFNPRQILNMTDAVLALARAAGEGTEADTLLAAQLIAGNLRAFGAEAQDAARFADVFAAAVNNSNFTLEQLMTALSTAAPVAKRYGLSLEETVALLAQMTNLNIDASTAGTAFRNMLLKLSDAAGRAKFNEALQQATGTTIKFTDAAGNLKPLPDLLFSIGEAMKGLGTAEQGKLLSDLFGLRAVVPAAALGQGKNPFQDLLSTLQNSSGAAKRTAQEMDAGIGGAFRRLASSVEGVAIAIGEAIAGPLSAFTDWVSMAIGPITEWINRNQETVALVAGIAAAAVIAGVAFLTFGGLISVVGSAFGLLAGAIKIATGALMFFLSPIGLVVAGITGIIAAIEYFTGAISSGVATASTALVSMAEMAKSVIGSVFKAIQAGRFDLAFEATWLAVRIVWRTALDWLLTKWEGFRDSILNIWTEARFGLAMLMVRMWGGLRKAWAVGVGNIKWAFFKGIEAILSKAADFAASVVELIGGALVKIGVLSQESVDAAAENIRNNDTLKFLRGKVKEAEEQIKEDKKRIDGETQMMEKSLTSMMNDELKKREQSTKKAQSKRKAEIESLKEELKGVQNQIEQLSKESGSSVDDLIDKQNQAIEDLKNKALEGMPETGIAGPARPAGIIRGLEKGSVEALQAAAQNAQNAVFNKMLGKQDEQVKATRELIEVVENKQGLVVV